VTLLATAKATIVNNIANRNRLGMIGILPTVTNCAQLQVTT
jgi:hypothetical protein